MSARQVEILLVEDSPYDAELTLRALKKNNLVNHIVHVTDGAEALDFVFARGRFAGRPEADLPKVALLDLNLPKVKGLEVLREMKSDPIASQIPVVVFTSSQEDRDIVETYRLGVNSYVVKPTTFADFVATVQELTTYWLLFNQSPTSCGAVE